MGTHVEAVAQLSSDDAYARRVPDEAKRLSAFFRVWWYAGRPAPCALAPRPR